MLLRRRVDPRRLDHLATELSRRGVTLRLEVDVRPLWGTSPRFAVNVLRVGIVLFDRDPAARQRREAGIMVAWLDFAPTWVRMRDRMFARWTHG
ncbi:MAG: hypothetical protein HYY06_24650 [Deltaproteobacteria bacterium]|nr:hypothetical protein [Deltaproteobacteria bacterium]